jgi:arylsulfatase A-like enzyme
LKKQSCCYIGFFSTRYLKYSCLLIICLLIFTVCGKKIVPKYNVLLITIDTLRADHLGYHGYQRNTSPFIDSMAKKSCVFLDVTVQSPKTTPSIASMITSKYVDCIGVKTNWGILPGRFLTIPEVMKKHELATVAYTTNANLTAKNGIAQGFDEFTFFPGAAAQVTEKTIKRLARGFDKKFFLWLHYIDPHGPYTPPAPYNTMFVNDEFYNPSLKVNLDYTPMKGLNKNYVLGAVPFYQQEAFKGNPKRNELAFYISQYDGEIRYLDEEIKKLVNYMDEKGLLENTIVVFTADHGEGLGEHNYFFEHGWFAYQDQISVPLFIYIPNAKKCMKIREPVELLDLAPTLLELLKIPVPEDFQGKSLLPYFKGKKRKTGFIYSQTPKEYPEIYRMLRLGKWKYIIAQDGKEEFYNLAQNPGEIVNLANNINGTHKCFLLLKKSIKKGPWASIKTIKGKRVKKKELDEETKKNLESLGYL